MVSPLTNLASVCGRTIEDGSLKKASKAANVLCSYKTHPEKEGEQEPEEKLGEGISFDKQENLFLY